MTVGYHIGQHSTKRHFGRKIIPGKMAEMQEERVSKTSGKKVGKPNVPKGH